MITTALWAFTAALLAPVIIFCLESWLAMLPGRRRSAPGGFVRPPVIVLTPAHNEQAVLGPTLAALNAQLHEQDRVVVVADNCTDLTAEIARLNGATVIERNDPLRRGKGYALDCGLKELGEFRGEVVIVLDADCILEPGAIDALTQQVIFTGRPAQAVYLMETAATATPRDRVSAWAFMVKNFVRPLGLSRLGLPCPLTGTGMAFPRAVLSSAALASGNLVEDMQLGLDLALIGYPPRLCPDARVIGRLPTDSGVAFRQRQRWEHGHLRTILVQAPRMLWLGLVRRRWSAVAMGMDLMVPPLSLLVLLLVLGILLATAAATTHGDSWLAAIIIAGAAVAMTLTIFAAWIKFGRACLPPRSLIGAVSYVIWKLPLYAMFVFRPQKQWVRTPRSANPIPEPAKSA